MSCTGSPGVGNRSRALESYEGFSYEAARVRPADLGYLRDLVRKGISYGWSRLARRGEGFLHWEVNSAGECEAPVVTHWRGDASRTLVKAGLPAGVREYRVSTLWRCRQCGWCRAMRSHHWAHRAEAMFRSEAVTWLGTITLSPFHHAKLDAQVARGRRKTFYRPLTGIGPRKVVWLKPDLKEVSEKELFRLRCQALGDWVTLWLKRVREAERRRRSGKDRCGLAPRFSYLLVAEEHRSEKTSTTMVGRPHYHILIHEALPYELVRADEYYVTQKGVVRVADAAMIRKHWPLGFTQFERCSDSRQASYLCKYLSKDMLWRVRASEAYGDTGSLDDLGCERAVKLAVSTETPRATVEVGPEDRGLSDVAKPVVKPGQAIWTTL